MRDLIVCCTCGAGPSGHKATVFSGPQQKNPARFLTDRRNLARQCTVVVLCVVIRDGVVVACRSLCDVQRSAVPRVWPMYSMARTQLSRIKSKMRSVNLVYVVYLVDV